MQILSGLEANSVSRLRMTWSSLPNSSRKLSQLLFKNLLSIEQNFGKLRLLMSVSEPPAVPYAGMLNKRNKR
jgi:hypothetical protein